MKARNILNSNLLSKIQLWNDFLKKMYFKIFCLDFPEKKKNFERKFFKKKITQPPKTNFQMILNTENDNYMKV